MRFEWDSKKNRINQTKHNGLDFETAAHIFDDPNVMFMEDRVVGESSGGLLLESYQGLSW